MKRFSRPILRTDVVILGVYPRVGGGTVLNATDSQAIQGLSPRGRGNHLLLA